MRFLIVDDDEGIHLLLQAMLAEYAVCDCFASGETALAAFNRAHEEEWPYDVVFMDILMPGMDGHQAAEIMREQEKEFGVAHQEQFKLVMITSLVDDTNVSKAFFNTDAICYLVKPLDRSKVLDELRQNLIL
ncbi:response regulator [Pseudodesulfovibrio cashew]|uniref:Response regulator n=1 Tax=Pseudodesulfovibrio cashew TaxID=2678688 RepID=A0A6I6JF94_9BACT|nr:response regulator [Pseudodesulfovibrio cashew]QGY40851.1 response regulator [Pseudodesulfovibrio cashew]